MVDFSKKKPMGTLNFLAEKTAEYNSAPGEVTWMISGLNALIASAVRPLQINFKTKLQIILQIL